MKRIFKILLKLWLTITIVSAGAAWIVYKSPEEVMSNLGYIDIVAHDQMVGFDSSASRRDVEGYTRQLKQKTGIDFQQSMIEVLGKNANIRNIKVASSEKESGIATFDSILARIVSSELPPRVRPVTLCFEAGGIGQIGFTGLFVEGSVFSPSAMLGRSEMFNSIFLRPFSIMIVYSSGESVLSQDKKVIDEALTLFYIPENMFMDYYRQNVEPLLRRGTARNKK